jgi:DNA-3-methyladenine glycosylase I
VKGLQAAQRGRHRFLTEWKPNVLLKLFTVTNKTKPALMSYCQAIERMPAGEKKSLHKAYHDHYYGFPIHNDNELFGRLIMEINQAGLSWETILKKEMSFRQAYNQFNINKIAAYTDEDRARLLADAGIIRNRLKINAAIENAKVVLTLQEAHGSFEKWLASHHPQPLGEWLRLFKKTFLFTGGAIVNEFLTSIGVLPGAHAPECAVYKKVLRAKPMWRGA